MKYKEGEKFAGKYRIKSARLKGYDYSSDGAYFVTICTQSRECFFGNVVDGEVRLTRAGQIVENIWKMISEHYSFVRLDEFVVMPNHFHGIVIINRNIGDGDAINFDDRDAINRVCTMAGVKAGGITKQYNPMLNSYSLSKIIRWYKGRATFEIKKWTNRNDFSWQARFYDRIIWDEKALGSIRQYIIDNPKNWEFDKNNLKSRRDAIHRVSAGKDAIHRVSAGKMHINEK